MEDPLSPKEDKFVTNFEKILLHYVDNLNAMVLGTFSSSELEMFFSPIDMSR